MYLQHVFLFTTSDIRFPMSELMCIIFAAFVITLGVGIG
ncbi:MAG: hypothetical protein JG781_2377, partial [Peptococcaceae bacterium]|nr:hypothetical protein [Peptococcaceae bacterium]